MKTHNIAAKLHTYTHRQWAGGPTKRSVNFCYKKHIRFLRDQHQKIKIKSSFD